MKIGIIGAGNIGSALTRRFVTIPEKNIPSLPADLFKDVPASAVVIDTGNYYPRQRDGRIDAIENGMPESRWVAQQLGRPVIKAFNNIYAPRTIAIEADSAHPEPTAVKSCPSHAHPHEKSKFEQRMKTSDERRDRFLRGDERCISQTVPVEPTNRGEIMHPLRGGTVPTI